MSLDPAVLLSSPEYHCLGFDAGRAVFVRLDREHYRRSIFLDRRAQPIDPRPQFAPIEELVAAMPEAPTNGGRWIFHIAHCGSTLLANLLDCPGGSLVLREPPSLRQVGIERGQGATAAEVDDRLRLACHLTNRRFDPREPVLAKANVPVNFLIDELDALRPSEPAIALYLGWEDYLLAILRTDQHRVWVRRVTDNLRLLIERELGVPLEGSPPLRAAALWLAQMRIYERHLGRNSNSVGLDAEKLFAEPIKIAEAAARHLLLGGVDPSENRAQLGSYSKNPGKSFTSEDRKERAAHDRLRLSAELNEARQWLDRISQTIPIPDRLSRTLA